MKSYEKMDAVELVVACKNRDDGAFAELVARYTPMMRNVVSAFSVENAAEDELLAEACVALHSAAMRYDTEQTSVTFGLYARICVHNRLIDLCRKASNSVSVVDVDGDEVGDDSSIESGIIRREAVQTLMSGAKAMLSEYEYKVLLLHVQGYKTAAIAKMLDRTAKSVDNAKSRIFRRMRSEFSGLYPL